MRVPRECVVFAAKFFFLILFTFIFTTVKCNASGILKWKGCETTREAFMVELARAYKNKTGLITSLSGGGSTRGIRAVNAGNVDMGGSCRLSLPEIFPNEEGDVYFMVIAWDALVPIVNATNPVSSISLRQLKDLLIGRITNWKELGGEDKDVLVLAREGKISGTGYMIRRMFFEDEKVDFPSSVFRVKNSKVLENKIYLDKYAIGITGVSGVKKRIAEGKKIKILSVDGVEATTANISRGTYPFFRPLNIVVKGKPTGEVKTFLDWVVSDEGQEIIESIGTVSMRMAAGLKRKFKYWDNTGRILNFDNLP